VSAHRHHGRRRGLIGNGPRLPRGFLQIGEREVVGVGVTRTLARLRADARALAHMTGGLFHRPLLEDQLFADAVFEVEVGVIHPAGQGGPEQALHRGRSQPEPILEKALRAREHVSLLKKLREGFLS